MQPSRIVVLIRIMAALSLLLASIRAQQNPRQLFERAQMMQEIGNSQEAIQFYNQVIALAKDDCGLESEAQFLVGELYERLGRKAEALRSFAAVKTCPNQPKWVQRAKAKIDAANARDNPPPRIAIKESGPSRDGLFLASVTFPRSDEPGSSAFDPIMHRAYFKVSHYEVTRSTAGSKPAERGGLRRMYGPSTLVVIATDTNTVIKQIPFSTNVSYIGFNPVNNKLYAAADHYVEIIDTSTYSRFRILFSLPALPNEIAVNAVTNKIYLTCQGFNGNDKLFVIDGATNTVAGPFDLEGVSGTIKINPTTNRIYVVTGHKTRVFNGINNSVVVDLPNTRVCAVDSKHNQLYADVGWAIGIGPLVALDGDTHNVIATFELNSRVSRAAADLDADRLYVCLTDSHQILIVDTATNSELVRLVVGFLGELAVDASTGRLYVGSYTGTTNTISVLARESLVDNIPEELYDEFDSSVLDPGWATTKDRNYSLTENPGYLRYHIAASPVAPPFLITRRFRGDHWTFEMKVSYNTGTSGGARNFTLGIGFGELPLTEEGSPHSQVSIHRERDSWNDCCPGEVEIELRDNGTQVHGLIFPPNATDSYIWRITRQGRKITVERSDDGMNFTLVAEHTFGSQIDGVVQFIGFTHGNHQNTDAYADYDYVRLTKIRTSQPQR